MLNQADNWCDHMFPQQILLVTAAALLLQQFLFLSLKDGLDCFGCNVLCVVADLDW